MSEEKALVTSHKSLQNVNEFTANDIKKYICPTATEKEFFEFCQIVKARNLNPFLKEVHFVKYGNNPGEVVVGKDAIIKRAKKVEGYKGFKSGWFNETGEKLEFPIGKIHGAWCEVYAENKETLFVPVLMTEYTSGKATWKTKPATMIRKVAVVQAHREFAPEETGGLYEEEELSQGGYDNEEIAIVKLVSCDNLIELERLCVQYKDDHGSGTTGWASETWKNVTTVMKNVKADLDKQFANNFEQPEEKSTEQKSEEQPQQTEPTKEEQVKKEPPMQDGPGF